MFDLTGMTALVTGASGGIGSAICAALAGQGARLAVSGSNAAKLEACTGQHLVQLRGVARDLRHRHFLPHQQAPVQATVVV